MQEAAPKIAGKRTEPTVPASDPRFKWTSGSDVQATWRRFGWTPPSEGRTQFYEEPVQQPTHVVAFRRGAR